MVLLIVVCESAKKISNLLRHHHLLEEPVDLVLRGRNAELASGLLRYLGPFVSTESEELPVNHFLHGRFAEVAEVQGPVSVVWLPFEVFLGTKDQASVD